MKRRKNDFDFDRIFAILHFTAVGEPFKLNKYFKLAFIKFKWLSIWFCHIKYWNTFKNKQNNYHLWDVRVYELEKMLCKWCKAVNLNFSANITMKVNMSIQYK